MLSGKEKLKGNITPKEGGGGGEERKRNGGLQLSEQVGWKARRKVSMKYEREKNALAKKREKRRKMLKLLKRWRKVL